MPFKNKFAVTLAFSCRVPIIPVAILRFTTLYSNSDSRDYTWDIVLAVVMTQVEMHFSLIASTIPCLRPFLKALDTGYLATQAAQVDRSIIDPGMESSVALKSKGSTNDPGSNRNSDVRNSRTTSYRNSLQSRTTTCTHTPGATYLPIGGNDMVPSSPPLPLIRQWKLPEDVPVLDPCSSPAITSIHHPRQWRTGPSEAVQKAKRLSNSTLTTIPHEDDTMLSTQGVDKWVIHKTVGYAVTRSTSTLSPPE
jgi:hypothetical protein